VCGNTLTAPLVCADLCLEKVFRLVPLAMPHMVEDSRVNPELDSLVGGRMGIDRFPHGNDTSGSICGHVAFYATTTWMSHREVKQEI
jgi:hypothetical protein